MRTEKREPGLLRNIDPLLHRGFFNELSWPSGRFFSNHLQAPKIDLLEKEDCYLISADLPGLNKDDVELTIRNGVLSIKAHREEQQEIEGEHVILKERHIGEYTRELSLGSNASEEGVSAEFNDGVLSVTVKKVENSKTKPIKIDIS
jgi:HSP20 family protein